MGISNTIPPSRLIQPGVVANTAARPTSPFTGQAIYQVDTNQMLIWNGTAWVIPNTPAQNPTGLEFIKSQTIGTTVSSVTVTAAFSSTYDNYRIIYSNGSASAVDNLIQMTIGSPVSAYRFAQQVGSYGTGSVLTYSVSGTGGVNFWNVGYTGVSNEAYSTIELQSPYLAINKTIQANGGRNNALLLMNGVATDAVSRTDFTFTPASGTLTGGTIRVYGYRNS